MLTLFVVAREAPSFKRARPARVRFRGGPNFLRKRPEFHRVFCVATATSGLCLPSAARPPAKHDGFRFIDAQIGPC
jgi:hypothetical protein